MLQSFQQRGAYSGNAIWLQAPTASQPRDFEDELERAAHTPLPEDAGNSGGNQQTEGPADGAAQQVL